MIAPSFTPEERAMIRQKLGEAEQDLDVAALRRSMGLPMTPAQRWIVRLWRSLPAEARR